MTSALISTMEPLSPCLCFTPCYGTTCQTQLQKFMSANVQIRGGFYWILSTVWSISAVVSSIHLSVIILLIFINKYEYKWLPHLRVRYGHTFRLHGGPPSHTRGYVRVSSSRTWRQVSASLLQRQLPPGQVRPHRRSPLGLSPVLLSRTVPHAVGGWAVRVFCGHGSHCVCETAGLFVRVGVQPLAAWVTAHSHGRRGGGSGAGAGGGRRSTGEQPPASTWPGPACGPNVQGPSRAGKTEREAVSYKSDQRYWSTIFNSQPSFKCFLNKLEWRDRWSTRLQPCEQLTMTASLCCCWCFLY